MQTVRTLDHANRNRVYRVTKVVRELYARHIMKRKPQILLHRDVTLEGINLWFL